MYWKNNILRISKQFIFIMVLFIAFASVSLAIEYSFTDVPLSVITDKLFKGTVVYAIFILLLLLADEV